MSENYYVKADRSPIGDRLLGHINENQDKEKLENICKIRELCKMCKNISNRLEYLKAYGVDVQEFSRELNSIDKQIMRLKKQYNNVFDKRSR